MGSTVGAYVGMADGASVGMFVGTSDGMYVGCVVVPTLVRMPAATSSATI